MRQTGGKLLLTLGAPLVFTACATMGPPQPPSLELPKPPSDLRAVRKGNQVLLTWTRPSVTTDRSNLRGPVPVLICRAPEASMSRCGTPVGHFTGGAMLAGAPSAGQKAAQSSSKKARITDSYTDVLGQQMIPAGSAPVAFVTYAVEAVNAHARSAGLSNQVRVPMAATLPPPQDFAAKVSDQGVVLTWTETPVPQNTEPQKAEPQKTDQATHYVYRLYRRSEGSRQPLLLGELPPATEHSMTFTDGDIEWEQTYYYHAEAVTIINQPDKSELQVEGEDSSEIRVYTHDVFPPAAPSGLQAVFSGPGQAPFIDLIWAPISAADLAGYNVYRHEAGAAQVRVNAELVKDPAYRDAKISPGKTYFYSVSAVDVRGNESARSQETSERAPAE